MKLSQSIPLIETEFNIGAIFACFFCSNCLLFITRGFCFFFCLSYMLRQLYRFMLRLRIHWQKRIAEADVWASLHILKVLYYANSFYQSSLSEMSKVHSFLLWFALLMSLFKHAEGTKCSFSRKLKIYTVFLDYLLFKAAPVESGMRNKEGPLTHLSFCSLIDVTSARRHLTWSSTSPSTSQHTQHLTSPARCAIKSSPALPASNLTSCCMKRRRSVKPACHTWSHCLVCRDYWLHLCRPSLFLPLNLAEFNLLRVRRWVCSAEPAILALRGAPQGTGRH